MSSWDFLTKFILVGDVAVGKSSLLVRLTDDRFLVNPETTIGIEFGSHVVKIEETGERIKLNCWDTAGSETFRSITRSYYRGAAGALLVYSVVDRASFLHIGDWLRDVRQQAEDNVSIILVGNKADLCEREEERGEGSAALSAGNAADHKDRDESNNSGVKASRDRSTPKDSNRRQVSTEEAEEFAKREGLLFVEASAKTGKNVEEAFKQAARNVHANFQANRPDASARSGLMSDTGRATVVPASPNNVGSATRSCCTIV